MSKKRKVNPRRLPATRADVNMITTYTINGNTVRIHDPAETPEAKERRQERIKAAAVRFWKAKERQEADK